MTFYFNLDFSNTQFGFEKYYRLSGSGGMPTHIKIPQLAAFINMIYIGFVKNLLYLLNAIEYTNISSS